MAEMTVGAGETTLVEEVVERDIGMVGHAVIYLPTFLGLSQGSSMPAVTTKLLSRAVRLALTENQTAICAHIDERMTIGRYTGIEDTFARPLNETLRNLGVVVEEKMTTADVGTKNFFSRKTTVGRLDAVFVDSSNLTAAEYKAVRMPRRKGNPLFDISQIASDAQRLRQATKLTQGWVVAFVYGPMAEDARSDIGLWRDFHSQMFLECQNAIAGEHMSQSDDNYKLTRALGWHVAPDGHQEGREPQGAAVKVGRLGSVIIECKSIM